MGRAALCVSGLSVLDRYGVVLSVTDRTAVPTRMRRRTATLARRLRM
jgi:hypothetical protein